MLSWLQQIHTTFVRFSCLLLASVQPFVRLSKIMIIIWLAVSLITVEYNMIQWSYLIIIIMYSSATEMHNSHGRPGSRLFVHIFICNCKARKVPMHKLHKEHHTSNSLLNMGFWQMELLLWEIVWGLLDAWWPAKTWHLMTHHRPIQWVSWSFHFGVQVSCTYSI